MAGIKDILDIERERSEPMDWLNIHLFQEGSFYRAYEVSAWLCHTHISQFKVTHRHVKGIDQPIAFVGFPVTSFEKRLPEGAAVASVADKHIVLTLPAPETAMSVDDARNDFAVWKSRQHITESKDNGDLEQTGRTAASTNGGKRTLFSIAQEILSYPIENHSPIECMLFLSSVKNDLTYII